MPLLLLPFFVYLAIEIWLAVIVVGLVGFFPAVFLMLLTSVAGGAVLQRFQVAAIGNLRQLAARGGVPPIQALFDGSYAVAGGVLLLIPGFFTDLLGVACLLIFVLRRLVRPHSSLSHSHQSQSGADPECRFGDQGSPRQPGDSRTHITIDGEYKRED